MESQPQNPEFRNNPEITVNPEYFTIILFSQKELKDIFVTLKNCD